MKKALICPSCDEGKLMEKGHVELNGTARGEGYVVTSDALVCPNCGFRTIPKEKMGAFALAVADAYRRAHDLLTSKDLKHRRRNLGMTQEQFAKYTGVSVASLKRWESGQIQDTAMDALIRVKTDVDTARANLQALEQEITEQRISSGTLGDFDVDLSVFSASQIYTTRKPAFAVSCLIYESFAQDAA